MDFKIEWPDSKKFAFTIVDDPDTQTIHNGKPVYDLLQDLGFLTTKLIWPLEGYRNPYMGVHDDNYKNWIGTTCQDSDFLAWVRELEHTGFEIGLHNVTYHSSLRGEIIKGLEQFNLLLKHTPQVQVNHMECRDNLYWFDNRLSGINRYIYKLITRNAYKNYSQGHLESSEYFWGDICQSDIRFVRNFVFKGINTLNECPLMPYHDANRPYVNYWFAASDAADLNSYLTLLKESNQDKLEEEGGLCIVYTHFGKGFVHDKKLNAEFTRLMERLSKKNGWFVPVTSILNYMLRVKGHCELSDKQRNYLERKWLFEKITNGGTS